MTPLTWMNPDGMEIGSAAYYHWMVRQHSQQGLLDAMYPDGLVHQPNSCNPPEDLIALCQRAASTPPGCFVEVGVYMGGSAYQLMRVALQQKRGLYLYDTFAGMPYSDPTIDTLVTGQLNHSSLEGVRKALGHYPYIEEAVFPQVRMMPPSPIAFAHIDVDQYQAYIETCQALAPLMTPGGIMWFDDVPVLEGARKAVRELFPAKAIRTDDASGRWFVEFL